MSCHLKCVMGLSVARSLQPKVSLLSCNESVPNLVRCFAAVSISKSTRSESRLGPQLLGQGSYLVPHRFFHKQLIEVRKRIKWVKPQKVHCTMPVKSGDLSGLPVVNQTLAPKYFLDSSEYQNAPDVVKRILSLNFQPRLIRRDALVDANIGKVKRHAYDVDSFEAKMAKYTVSIRRMQNHMKIHPRDGQTRADTKELIDFRKTRLNTLRKIDYRKFEWLLERLDLLFKPYPPIENARVERKASIKKVALEYQKKVEKQLLNDYRNALMLKRKDFFRRKLSTMKSIVAHEASFGLDPSFTTEEIQELQIVVDALDKEEKEALLKKEAAEKEDF